MYVCMYVPATIVTATTIWPPKTQNMKILRSPKLWPIASKFERQNVPKCRKQQTTTIVWVYFHSNFCSGLQNTHLFCNRERISRSRSPKVDNFSTKRMRLSVSPSLWLWSYLAPFMRYDDLLAKNCVFFLSLCHSVPLPLLPLENFAVKLTMRKL